jgi:hypothetical protein
MGTQRRDDRLVDTGALLKLAIHLPRNLLQRLQCHLFTIIPLLVIEGDGTIFGHSDPVELFQVGGEDGDKVDTLVEGQALVCRFQKYPVVER